MPGEVAEVLASRTEFFRVKTDVLCVAEHLLENDLARGTSPLRARYSANQKVHMLKVPS